MSAKNSQVDDLAGSIKSTMTDKRNVSTNTHHEEERDSIISLFYKPHTISMLMLMLGYFMYVALWEQTDFNKSPYSVLGIIVGDTQDALADAKVGILAVFLVFTLLVIMMFPPGPFVRPHPLFWRIVTAFTAWYLLLLTFILFQPKAQARRFMRDWFDSSLGVPLKEKSYAADCDITSSYQKFKTNFLPQIDIFVVAHAVGWFCKAIMLRDYFLCWILSVSFELLEYTLEVQLPNFAECWWDHWILDVLVCNWLGLWLGMKACHYFEMKTYEWRGRSQSRMRRVVGQFTPLDWTSFDWAYTRNYKHFTIIIVVCIVFLQGELNAFYLKYLLWLPPENMLNVYRLSLLFFAGTIAVKEVYQYLTDPSCKKLGHNAWLVIAVVQTETLICVKFSRGQGFKMIPTEWLLFWASVIIFLLGYALIKFGPWKRKLTPPEQQSPVQIIKQTDYFKQEKLSQINRSKSPSASRRRKI